MLVSRRRRLGGGRGLPGCSDTDFVFKLHKDALGRLFSDSFDLRKRLGVAGDNRGFEACHGDAAQDVEGSLGTDAGDMVDEETEKVAFRAGSETEENMGVFTDLEVREKQEATADGGKTIIAGEGDGNVITDAMHIENHMGGVRFDQDAFQKGDHRSKDLGLSVRRQAPLALVVALLTLWTMTSGIFAAEAASDLRVWLEAKFLGAPVSAPVANAQRTVLAGGRLEGGQFVGFTQKEWQRMRLSWRGLEVLAKAGAEADFKRVELIFVRDKRRVIEFVEMRSKELLVASAILAPQLSANFVDTLGEELLVAVPSRSRAFIFPKHGLDLSKYSGMIWEAYGETAYPVSVELFEWRSGVLKAVGMFER